MIWRKNLRSFSPFPNVVGGMPICSLPCHSMVNQQQKHVLHSKRIPLKLAGLDTWSMDFCKTLISERKSRTFNGLCVSGANSYWSTQYSVTLPCQFKHAIHSGPNLSRDFLVQLWITDMKLKKEREKRRRPIQEHVDSGGYERQQILEYANNDETVPTKGSEGLFSRSSVVEKRSYGSSKPFMEHIQYSSPEEALIAPLLSRSNLLITRDIEWANLTFGFEQENRYAIVDVCNPHVPAGFIREQSNVIMRQFLRRRRPFIASITDGYGNELFRVRRPFWWLTSSIYAEVGGKEVGVVHRRWHLWKRVYDLYLGNEQFAVVENPGFWYWTFTLKGINGEVLAEIDRDWRGFGFEIFTDAGQYVIRFGKPAHQPTSEPTGKVQELEVARPLTLLERAITVALAVSLDNDYFSRHGGWGLPFIAVAE